MIDKKVTLFDFCERDVKDVCVCVSMLSLTNCWEQSIFHDKNHFRVHQINQILVFQRRTDTVMENNKGSKLLCW